MKGRDHRARAVSLQKLLRRRLPSDDLKASSRLTINLGSLGVCRARARHHRHQLATPCRLFCNKCPYPRLRHAHRNTVAANYTPTWSTLTPANRSARRQRCLVRSTNSFRPDNTPKDTFAPRVGLPGSPWGPGRVAMRGRVTGWFYQPPTYSGQRRRAPLFTAAPFAGVPRTRLEQ